MDWHFRIQTPGEPTRDPIVGEFFSTDAIENPARALIREGVQNSLDAGTGGQVSIRIFLSNSSATLDPARTSKWMGGLWNHVSTAGNGLREPPSRDDPCPFLVFEDFGTTGLKGDPTQAFDDSDKRNSFFYFFRAEGRSGKGEQDRGRWGIGKHVFPRSSRISTSIGLTVRADDGRRLLMGHIVLRTHCVGGVHYSPDGYWGEKRVDSLVLPIEDPQAIGSFISDFGLTRKSEPGLSIIVPYIEPEITLADIKAAVIEDYFLPLLRNSLTVIVEAPGESTTLNSESLSDPVLLEGLQNRKDLQNLIDLAKWATSHKESEIPSLVPCILNRPEWSDDLVPADLVDGLRTMLDRGEKFAVRLHLTIREKNKAETSSFFDVFLWQDGCEDGRPVFIRKGIIIPDIHAPRTRGIRSLIVINDGPLATLLGDSENPAHTQWQKESSNFRGKYYYGPAYLEFVTRSVSNLVHALTAQEEEEDRNILLDIFSLPMEKTEKNPSRPDEKTKSKPGEDSGRDPWDVEPGRKRFRIRKIPGGFSITRGDRDTSPPVFLEVRCAYDVRIGNPLGKYDAALMHDAADFRIGHDGVEISESTGVEMLVKEDNRIRVRITDPEFRISVRGFDPNRDLYVKAKLEDGADDQEA
jgi:hypothetical protein